jgi:molybdopterin/thiamine biosynthesis adenylyltransferase
MEEININNLEPVSVELNSDDIIDILLSSEGINPANVLTPIETIREIATELADVVDPLSFLEIEETPTPVVQEEIISEENTPETNYEVNIIPTIEKNVNVNIYTSRFSQAIWAEKAKEMTVMLAGVGGIGSWTGFLLSRLGIRGLILIDDDVVDASNISGQLFKTDDEGTHKVSALTNFMYQYSNFYKTYSYNQKFTNRNEPAKIMICGFDNMIARKTYFNAWKKLVEDSKLIPNINLKEFLFIDGRLAAEEFQVFCFRGDDDYYIRKYESEYLFSDEEAEQTVCSYKQTTFMSNMIGSVINNLFVNYITNLCDVPLERDLPFITSYSADYMMFKTVH